MVFLDASAIIYLLEGDDPVRTATQGVLAHLRGEGEPPALAVSALSILECRVRPMRQEAQETLRGYDAFFSEPGLQIVALGHAVLERATRLRASVRLRTPDALQAASAMEADKEVAFVTGDGDFAAIPGLRVHRIPIPS